MKHFRIIRKPNFDGIEPEKIIPDQDDNLATSAISGLSTTDQLPEGVIHLYYTDARVDARISLFANTASNIGSGIGLFKQKTGVDLEFKSLLSSNKLSITPNVSGLTIDFDVNESNLNLNNIGGTLNANKGGTGFSLYNVGDLLFANTTTTLSKLPVSIDGKVLTLVGGLPTWITPTGGDITNGDNIGGGSELFQIKSGSDLVFRTLIADSNKITITQNANTINFDINENNLIGEANTASNIVIDGGGVYGLFTVKTGVDLPFKSLFKDNGISIDNSTSGLLKISVYEQELDINLIGGTPLNADNGGTGISSYVIGDLIYANTVSTLTTIPIGSFGEVLSVSGSGLPVWASITSISNPDVPTWVKISKTYLNLSTISLMNDISLFTLPVAGVIHAIKIKHSNSFTGGGASFYKVSVGIVGDLDKYISPFDVFTPSTDDNFEISNSFQSESHGFTTDVRLSVESDVNLDTINTGLVDVWLLVSRAP